MKYKIELTAEQMRVAEKALETYMRLLMGQTFEFADELAEINHPMKDNFDLFIATRDHIEEAMKAMFRIAFGPQCAPRKKTEDGEIAECMWDAIRFARGRSRWPFNFQVGSEPAPKIEKEE